MSKEPELFDYVGALKNQPRLTAPRPTFGPSPRQRQRFLPSSAQAPNKQMSSMYGKRDSVTESMKCPQFSGGSQKSDKSSSSTTTSSSNKSRWSNFAKTPSPPRETPKFIKARITLEQQTSKTSEINERIKQEKDELNQRTAVKSSVSSNHLFQTPSQTINATQLMSNHDDKTNPTTLDTNTKIQKLKQTGLLDKIRSMTAKLQIDEDEESDPDIDSGSRKSSSNGTVIDKDNTCPGAIGGGHQQTSSSDDEEVSKDVENDSNVPNKFLVNDSIMIIKETFSAKKKMIQLGMLPCPRTNSYPCPTSPEVASLKQQPLSRYFNRCGSKDEDKKSSSAGNVQNESARSEDTVKERSPGHYDKSVRSKSETSVYEVSIPINTLQSSVANDDSINQTRERQTPLKSSSAQKKKNLTKNHISSSASNLNCIKQPPLLPSNGSNCNSPVKMIKSSSCTSVDGATPAADKAKDVQPRQAPPSAVKQVAEQPDSRHDLKKLRIRGKVYFLLSLLGQGGSAKVYQVYDPMTQKNLAVKVVDLMKADTSTRAGYENEIFLLQKLSKCKRVVQLIDYERIKGSDGTLKRLFLVMEKGDADLSNVLKQFIKECVDDNNDGRSNKVQLDVHLIKHYWKEMLKAVHEIHSLGVVHSDLKPVNFISVSGKLKLIDFGIANAIESDATSIIKDNQIGTINYMAPESLQSRSDIDPRRYNVGGSKCIKDGKDGNADGRSFIKYNCKADIWSLGCILYNLVYGKPPFGHLPSLIGKIQAICNPNHLIDFPPLTNDPHDGDLIDCLKKCLERDPRRRPTTKELLEHPYLTRKPSVPMKDNLNTFKTPERKMSPSIVSQINSLTPNRYNELSKILQNMTKRSNY